MTVVLRTAVAAAAAFLMAQGALAEDCDGECGTPTGPNLNYFPITPVTKYGNFFTFAGSTVQGSSYYNTHSGSFYISANGGGTGFALDHDPVSFGSSDSLATLQAYFDPDPTAATAVQQGNVDGRASANMTLSYIVTLATADAATANAVQAFIGSNPFATVSGNYSLGASGSGSSAISASSSFGPNGDNSYGTATECDPGNLGGCGTGGFTFNLGFLRGDQFLGGNSNYFYALVNLTASAAAGSFQYGDILPGDASAFIDPTITLSSALQGRFGNALTLDVGGYGPPQPQSAAPEPASWALMLSGFGLIGATMRNRRTKVSFA